MWLVAFSNNLSIIIKFVGNYAPKNRFKIMENDVFFRTIQRDISIWSHLFLLATRPHAFCVFPGSFWPFFNDFPKEITFFKLLYKTFYSHTLRLLEPLISYFDSRENDRGQQAIPMGSLMCRYIKGHSQKKAPFKGMFAKKGPIIDAFFLCLML